VPLVVRTGPANVPDGKMLMSLLCDLRPMVAPRGRPRRYPEFLLGDGAYGSAANREECRQRRIRPLLARQQREHGGGLGEIRYVVERTLAWFGHNRRLKLCYEKIGEHFQAFHDLAAALLCAHKLCHAA
jgi:IS5 family transposase